MANQSISLGQDNQKTKSDAENILNQISDQSSIKYGMAYGISVSPNQKAKSNVFGTTGFNSLFGYTIKDYNKKITSSVFQISDIFSSEDANEFGKKLLLPTQSGFVYNLYIASDSNIHSLFKGAKPNPDIDTESDLKSKHGHYFNIGFTPLQWKKDTSSDQGWLAYGSLGKFENYRQFGNNDSRIGANLKMGYSFRSIISGLSSSDFKSNIFSNKSYRFFHGPEIILALNIGDFKPNIIFTSFTNASLKNVFKTNRSIPSFTEPAINITFDITQYIPSNNTATVSTDKISNALIKKAVSLDGKFLTDSDANYLTALADTVRLYTGINEYNNLISIINGYRKNTGSVIKIQEYDQSAKKYNEKTISIGNKVKSSDLSDESIKKYIIELNLRQENVGISGPSNGNVRQFGIK